MNDEQIEHWNGPAAVRWITHQEALDRALDPFGQAVIARAIPKAGERVLDIGCGTGATVLAIADRVGESGHVIGVDVSSPMLARAMERTADRSNVSFANADASTHRFERAADLVVSRFGVMFFRDPVSAFQNIQTALRPGGRIVFACWRAVSENPWVHVPLGVALRHVAPLAPSGPEDPGPFSFADRARVERILGSAGFGSILVDPFDVDVVMSIDGVESAADFAMTAGMAARLLVNADDETKGRVRADLGRVFTPYCKEGRVSLPGAAWIASAIAS